MSRSKSSSLGHHDGSGGVNWMLVYIAEIPKRLWFAPILKNLVISEHRDKVRRDSRRSKVAKVVPCLADYFHSCDISIDGIRARLSFFNCLCKRIKFPVVSRVMDY